MKGSWHNWVPTVLGYFFGDCSMTGNRQMNVFFFNSKFFFLNFRFQLRCQFTTPSLFAARVGAQWGPSIIGGGWGVTAGVWVRGGPSRSGTFAYHSPKGQTSKTPPPHPGYFQPHKKNRSVELPAKIVDSTGVS